MVNFFETRLAKRTIFYPFLMSSLIFSSFIYSSCSSPTDPASTAPSGHTVNKNGVMHRPGLTSPLTNCVECHGSDLKGGSVKRSCFSCHGQKW